MKFNLFSSGAIFLSSPERSVSPDPPFLCSKQVTGLNVPVASRGKYQ